MSGHCIAEERMPFSLCLLPTGSTLDSHFLDYSRRCLVCESHFFVLTISEHVLSVADIRSTAAVGHILPPGLSLVPLEQWLLRFLFRMALQGPVSPDQSPSALWWWLFGNEASSSVFIEFFSWHDQNKSPPPV